MTAGAPATLGRSRTSRASGHGDSRDSRSDVPDATSKPPAAAGRDPIGPARNRRPRIVLAMHGVTKSYPNGKSALRGVDLTVPEGDFVFLVGPSGAGKSTLIKLLIRDELATKGLVLLDGRDLGPPQASRRPQAPAQDRHRLPGLQAPAQQDRPRQRRASRSRSPARPRRATSARPSSASCAWSGLRARPTSARPSSRAASSSGPPSPGPSSTTRASSSPTSPPATSTR